MTEAPQNSAGSANATNAIALVLGLIGIFSVWATDWPIVVRVLITGFVVGCSIVLALLQDKNQLKQVTDWIDEGGLGWGYRNLVGGVLTRMWFRVCNPAPNGASIPRTFRAALTIRTLDLSAFLAVVYPILSILLVWLVTGIPTGFDDNPFLNRLETGSLLHAFSLVAAAAFLTAILLQIRALFVQKREPSALADVPVIIAFVVAYAINWSDMLPFHIEQLLSGGVVVLGVIWAFGHFPLPGSTILTLSSIFSTYILLSGHSGAPLGMRWLWVVLAIGAGFFVMSAFQWLQDRGHAIMARVFQFGTVVCLIIVTAWYAGWEIIEDRGVATFMFFGVFPLINALFDVISYAVTLSLIRAGMRAHIVPALVFGLADLAIALILFVLLGVTLVTVVSGLNLIAGAQIIDVGRILALVAQGPSPQSAWIYFMICSTLLPTAVHLLLAMLSLERVLVPVARRYSALLRTSRNSVLQAGTASVAGGILFTLPIAAAWGLCWVGYMLSSDALGLYGDGYMKILLQISAWIGAI